MGDGVEPTGVPGVAAPDAPDRHETAPQGAVAPDRLGGISRTSGLESTVPTE